MKITLFSFLQQNSAPIYTEQSKSRYDTLDSLCHCEICCILYKLSIVFATLEKDDTLFLSCFLCRESTKHVIVTSRKNKRFK